ncbi:uncharacterized protein MONBRDRAFT_6351 [Monosiga brevicollis MX1]|uniref:Uncharacterized protein n=1 Tax=Monosiga brevicollis TaxID=81824 RepID=A9UTK8_MONBE|nr:uncharacterized protein MONBRDRAFT_6351 [Monosiga brevicollis MX1]EDQ91512.1 predicted protein [Monosiga brevicollis MX1]|eukprot:XP_001743934.1 hypothetical protein [Monosiga brevicollis MX1]
MATAPPLAEEAVADAQTAEPSARVATQAREQTPEASIAAPEGTQVAVGPLAQRSLVPPEASVILEARPGLAAANVLVWEDLPHPLSIDEREMLVPLPQLRHVQDEVDHFLENGLRQTHPLYELICSYIAAKAQVKRAQQSVTNSARLIQTHSEQLWIKGQDSVVASDRCGDKVRLSETVTYETTTYDQAVHASLRDDLRLCRNIIFDEAMRATCVFENWVFLAINLTLDVLAYFARHPDDSITIADELQAWLRYTMSALLLIGTMADHRFLLNHILHFHAGHAEAFADLIQLPPDFLQNHTAFDHALAMIWLFLQPVVQFDGEEVESSQRLSSSGSDALLLDSDGHSLMDANVALLVQDEEDCLAILTQLPIKNILNRIFTVSGWFLFGFPGSAIQPDAVACWPVGTLSLEEFQRISVLVSTLIQILGSAFQDPYRSRHRYFAKLIAQLITESDPLHNLVLADAVVGEIIHLAIVCESTRTSALRDGRDALRNICVRYSPMLSNVLSRVAALREVGGQRPLYIFKHLPWNSWVPTRSDLTILQEFLAMPSTSVAFNLAIHVLSDLDFSQLDLRASCTAEESWGAPEGQLARDRERRDSPIQG